MDKNTLSQYGWVVIVIIIILILIGASANFAGYIKGFAFDTVESIPMPFAEFQTKLEIKRSEFYYSSLALAVDDVNAGTLGANADTDAAHAVAGIYKNASDKIFVSLLRDNQEMRTVTPKTDMTIKLVGHTLTSAQSVILDQTGGNLVIDGTVNGSRILATTDGSNPRCVQVKPGGSTLINGGTYEITAVPTSNNTAAMIITNNATIQNVNIKVDCECSDKIIRGLWLPNKQAITLNNVAIDAHATDSKVYALNYDGAITANNCSFVATGSYLPISDGTDYRTVAIGISVASTSTDNSYFNNCYVKGNHSGMQINGSNVYVNGGTYEGFAHGGIYATGDNVHIKNASIKECDWYGPETFDETYYTFSNHAAMYIGGRSGANNLSVYADNCKFASTIQSIIVRGISGETNNSFYVSNSTFTPGTYLRLDSPTHNVYLGAGNLFQISDFRLGTDCTESQIHYTEDVYDY